MRSPAEEHEKDKEARRKWKTTLTDTWAKTWRTGGSPVTKAEDGGGMAHQGRVACRPSDMTVNIFKFTFHDTSNIVDHQSQATSFNHCTALSLEAHRDMGSSDLT